MVGDLRKRSRLYGLTALVERGRLEASARSTWSSWTRSLARDEDAVRAVMTRHLGHVRANVGRARLIAARRACERRDPGISDKCDRSDARSG